jgi:SAM-dependent methyltransferase
LIHPDHVALLRAGVPKRGGRWADFGSGTGAFTLALADLLGPAGEIISIDRDASALRQQEASMRARFPEVSVEYRIADFTHPLDLAPLDGVVMANSLHFHRDKLPIVQRIRGYLRPGGHLILVEYDTDQGNPWVPYPRAMSLMSVHSPDATGDSAEHVRNRRRAHRQLPLGRRERGGVHPSQHGDGRRPQDRKDRRCLPKGDLAGILR